MKRLDCLHKASIVWVVHIYTPITSTDTIMEAHSNELGDKLTLRVLDEFHNLGTDIVHVSLVVSIVLPTIGVPPAYTSTLGVDDFWFFVVIIGTTAASSPTVTTC